MAERYFHKSLRHKNIDYRRGRFFVTMQVAHNASLLGVIVGEKVVLNELGRGVQEVLERMPQKYPEFELGEYVVMPNHIHMILVLGCGEKAGKNPDLQQIMAQLKSGISREIRKTGPDLTVWQRSFHDHVIRTQKDYEKIWRYIQTNPMRWDKDCFFIDPTMC